MKDLVRTVEEKKKISVCLTCMNVSGSLVGLVVDGLAGWDMFIVR